LKAERQADKLRATLVPKEVGHAVGACHSDRSECKVHTLVFQAGVSTRPGFGSGGAAGARQTHSDCGVAGDGAEPGAALSELSSGAESGAVVESGNTARILLEMVVQSFAPTGVVVIGIDDTLERRRGEKINAKGIYRDPVRSSRSQVVKASGLRWLIGLMHRCRPGADARAHLG
jgi:hypothetical protein